MNLDHDFVQESKLSEDQKKRFSPKMELFFPPHSSGHLRSDAHQSQIIGGDADVDHTQTIGGDTVKLLGGYIPPGFRHPCSKPRPGTKDTSATALQQKKVFRKIFQAISKK